MAKLHVPAGWHGRREDGSRPSQLCRWSESTQGARSWKELPANAVKYVRRIEELIGAPAAMVSTSPQRDYTIMMRDPFQD